MVQNGGSVKFLNGFFTANGIFPDDTYDADALKADFGALPDLKTLQATRKVNTKAS
jgi:quinohemoprotein ethanol dehydrogenase